MLKILRGKYPPIEGYSSELIDIIKRCLTQVEIHRKSAQPSNEFRINSFVS